MRDEDERRALGRRPRCRSASERAPTSPRHGQGYSRFEHSAHGIALDLLQFVPLADPVKISRLTLAQHVRAHAPALGHRLRRVGARRVARARRRPSIVTEIDPQTGALLARNPWNPAFGARVAFADLGGRQTAWTGDRREFLGRNGTLDEPGGARRRDAPLSGRAGAGLDPCAALQTPIELAPGRDGRDRRSSSARRRARPRRAR